MSNNRWEILALDIWGTPDDGWELNAAYKTGMIVYIDDIDDDQQIVDVLIENQVLAPSASPLGLDIEGDEYCLYINDAKDGFPITQLVPVD